MSRSADAGSDAGSDVVGDVVRAVVVDDEPAARQTILTLLAGREDVRVVGEATNGREAVEVVRRERPDLLFLDVQMPDQDGFGVLETLGDEVPRGVVFVTAHDEHAIRAFEVHALDYVLKPFGRPRFAAAVARALERLRALDALTLQRTLSSMAADRRTGHETAGDLALGPAEPSFGSVPSGPGSSGTAPSAPPHPTKRIGVRTGARVALVDVDAIDWVEALGDYARLHVAKQTHLVSRRMHDLELVLAGGRFLRIHRSLIVNLDRIRELHRESDGSGTIVLSGGVRLRVARGRWDALQQALGVEEF